MPILKKEQCQNLFRTVKKIDKTATDFIQQGKGKKLYLRRKIIKKILDMHVEH